MTTNKDPREQALFDVYFTEIIQSHFGATMGLDSLKDSAIEVLQNNTSDHETT